MSIGVYLRVSKGTGQDTASQRRELERWTKGQDQGVSWFEDKATGKTMDRPAFERLMAAVRTGEIKTVVVWRLDRLGRTAKGLTALFDELAERKVNLVSLRDGLDLATPAGRLMANVLASVAAYETEVRAERVHAGLEVAKAKGKHLGRPKGSGKGVPTKVTSEQHTLIQRMKGEGEGATAIARASGLSRQTIYRVLRETTANV